MDWPEAKPTLGTVRMGRSGRTLRLLGPDALSTPAAPPPPTSRGFTGLDGTAAAPTHQRAGPEATPEGGEFRGSRQYRIQLRKDLITFLTPAPALTAASMSGSGIDVPG